MRGIALHRPRLLLNADTTDHDGLRTTTPARTLLDLAGSASKRTLERALDRAEAQRLHLPVAELRERCRRRRGARTLRAVLDWHLAGSTITDSEAEEAFLAIVRRAGLPEPVPQHRALERRRDFAWPAHRLIVEIDSRGFHDTTAAFEDDRLRDNELTLAGYTVLRFTYRRVVHRPREVERDLVRALAASRSRLASAAAG